MPSTHSWTIPGAESQPIIGNRHQPTGTARGIVLIAHGFKGYKDYGFIPRLAQSLADAGIIAHRFNFSHSGMTNQIATFARPDLFERDTWNKQIHDLRTVIVAAIAGSFHNPGSDVLPYIVIGHSRGGVTALLTAGRFADDPGFRQPAGIITAAAPICSNPLSAEDANALRERGWIESPSSRTGQGLRIGREFLDEMLADPQGHDVVAQAGRIRCPILTIHGDADATVPVECASALHAATAARGELRIIPAADHVFNCPNPLPLDQPASPQLQCLIDSCTAFAHKVCAG